MNAPRDIPGYDEEADMQAAAALTLRDYFAAKALQGFAADSNATWKDGIAGMARSAYEFADAMLKARQA